MWLINQVSGGPRSVQGSDWSLVLTKMSRMWLDSRSVWHSVKCVQNGVPSGTMCLQLSTGHLLSLNTGRHNNLRIASPAPVTFRPWSSTMSHNCIQPRFLARGKRARGAFRRWKHLFYLHWECVPSHFAEMAHLNSDYLGFLLWDFGEVQNRMPGMYIVWPDPTSAHPKQL